MTWSVRQWFVGVIAVLLVGALATIGLAPPAAADSFGCPCTLFSPSEGPTGSEVQATDNASVELGVRFTVDAAVPITGVRFYKGPDNTGTHVGSLWSSTGTLLADATFTDETASGWQQVNFATPVTAVPGTVYVASYFAPMGHYSSTYYAFSSTGVDRGILHAPGGDPSSPNGLYVYTPVPAFPQGTYNGSNYWVDVVVGTPTVLSSITVSPASLALTKGGTAQVSANGTFSDATTSALGDQVTWKSADPTVATVSATGVVTAVGAGATTVTATKGSVSTSVPVTVRAVTSVRIGGLPASLASGLGKQLTATAVYSDASTADVTNTATWSSASPAVATVGPTGLLATSGVGTAAVSATFAGVAGTGTVTVTPATLVSLSVTPPTASLRTGATLRLTATARYTDGSSRDVTATATWKWTNLFVAVVGSGKVLPGVVLATLPGKAAITATFGGLTASTAVTVTLL